MLWRLGSTLAVENANSKLVKVSEEESFGDILVIAGLSVATASQQFLTRCPSPTLPRQGRGKKKIDFFLGKSPELWVGGGQES